MSLQWIEGFELNNVAEHRDELYDAATSSFIDTKAGRLHGLCAEGATSIRTLRTRLLDQHTTWVVGVAAQINAPYDSGAFNVCFIGLEDSAVKQLSAYIIPDGADDYRFEIYRGTKGSGGALLGTSPMVEGGTGFRYFEFKGVIDNTAGSYELKVDGAVILSDTSLDTQETANAFANQVFFEYVKDTAATIGTPFFDLDDIYVCNGSGTINNNYLGDQVVAAIEPSGVGSSTDFASESSGAPSGVANWSQVNEATTSQSDDDSGYVASSTVSDKDMHLFDNLPSVLNGTIRGVQVYHRDRLEVAGSRKIKFVVADGTNPDTDVGAEVTIDDDIYHNKDQIVELNPFTTNPFTATEIDASQWGFRVTL